MKKIETKTKLTGKFRADIIVPTWNQTEYTLRCLESVRQNTTNYRLIWVDNGSDTESRDAVQEEIIRHSNYYQLWSKENLGFIGGNNLALKSIYETFTDRSDYVVLLNNDVEVTPGWLDRMMTILDSNNRLSAVGPVTSECTSWQSFRNVRHICPNFKIPNGLAPAPRDLRAKILSDEYGLKVSPCRMLAFFCTVFRSEVFERIGYLDTAFGEGYGDDDDFCKRMNDAGMRLGLSMGSYVFHNHRTSFKAKYTEDQIKEIQSERLEVFEKKHGEKARLK